MSIEETYKGMWSSDPSLLKSLLDAGETIIIKIITKDEQLRAVKADKDCFIDLNSGTRFGRQMASTKDFADMAGRLGIMFLVPPRPLVLEPKPLEWTEIKVFGTTWVWEAKEDFLTYVVQIDGTWAVMVGGYDIVRTPMDSSHVDGIAAIQEWRVNHLKSMLP